MPYGLTNKEFTTLQALFAANSHIEQVILYGSRAKGNYKPFSDVDIVLVGDALSRTDINRLYASIDESSLPYKFDISLLTSLKSEELIAHIARVGITIYKK
jgi:predicted nucleotidyltransferase